MRFQFVFILLASVLLLAPSAQTQEKKINQLELFFYAPPKPMNWSGPTPLLRSTIKNFLSSSDSQENKIEQMDESLNQTQLRALASQLSSEEILSTNSFKFHPHAISHVDVHLACEDNTDIYAGTRGSNNQLDLVTKLLSGRSSLEVITENQRGRFYTRDEILQGLPLMKESGGMHQLSFQISKKMCLHIKRYLLDYEKSGQNKIYGGLGVEPLKGVGAGCSAFAMSVLKVAGLYHQTFDRIFTRQLNLPLELMNTADQQAKFNFYDIFLGNFDQWAKEDEPHFKIKFWDPQLMHSWVADLYFGKTQWEQKYTLVKDINSYRIEIDATKNPVPKQFVYTEDHLLRIQNEINRLHQNN